MIHSFETLKLVKSEIKSFAAVYAITRNEFYRQLTMNLGDIYRRMLRDNDKAMEECYVSSRC